MEYEQLAKRVDYHLSSPLMTEEQLHAGTLTARAYAVRSIVVRPSDLDLAKDWVNQEFVRLGSRSSAGPGDSTTAVKQYEVRDMLRRGAKDVEAKLNLGKMLSRQFQYVEIEAMQLVKACTEFDASLTLSLEASVLDEEKLIILCKIAKRSGVKMLSFTDYRPEQVELALKKLADVVELKLMVEGKALDEVLRLSEAGVARFGVRHPAALLDAWKAYLAQQNAAPAASSVSEAV
jgi:deoxyribose-phosphate aldolase